MRKILRDPVLQQRFETLGYVTLPVLGRDEVKELTDYYLKHAAGGDVKNSPYGIWMSIYDAGTVALRRQAMELIHSVAMPRLNEVFIDCKPCCGTYFVKVPSPKSFTWPHQDWSFVDYEEMHDRCSLKVWISLRDVDVDSGTLGFINGSSRFFQNPVGSPNPAMASLTGGHEPLLFEYLTYQPVRAGDALAFNNQTIHAAMPNSTSADRISVSVSMAPAEAPLYHYFLRPGSTDRLLKLRVEEDFFLEYSNRELSKLYQEGKLPGHCTIDDEVDFSFKPLSPAEMTRLCESHGSVRNGRPVALGR